MNQALHIFRKDARRLRIPLAIALAVQALFTYFEIRPHAGPYGYAGGLSPDALVDLLLPVAWWYLIVVLVHGEALPGDRQFWITRPYRWKSLLAAKTLFILAFVNLPVLFGDALILTAQGFSVPANWQGMLWRQIPFTIAFLLPALALVSLTHGLGQVIVAILLIVLRIAVGSIPFQPLPTGYTAVAWIEGAVETVVFLSVFSVVVLIQYRMRRTWLARGMFAALVIMPGISVPLGWQLYWQARVKPPAIDPAGIRIAFDSTRGRRAPVARGSQAPYVNVALPVTVAGAPDGVSLQSNYAELTIGAQAFVEGAILERDKNGYWETISVPVALFNRLRARPLGISIQPVVTTVRQTEFRCPLETGPVKVSYLGICESRQPQPLFLTVTCRWPLRTPPRTRVHAEYPGWDATDSQAGPREQFTGELSDSPFPAELSLGPVRAAEAFWLGGSDFAVAKRNPGTQVVFQTHHPVAHFRTDIEIPSVRLDDYAVTAP